MFDKVYLFLCRLPYSFGVGRVLQHNPLHWQFWYKQCFHLIGGVSLGFSLGWNWIIWVLFGNVFTFFLGFKECEDVRNGQSITKTIFDVLFWIVGLNIGRLLWGFIL